MSVFARCYSFAGRPRWENYQLILRKSQFYVWNTGLTSQLSKSVFLKFWGAPLPYPPLKCIWRFLAKLVIPKKQSCYLTVVFSLKRKTFLQNVQKKFKNLVHSSEIFKFYCFWRLLRQRKWSKLSKFFGLSATFSWKEIFQSFSFTLADIRPLFVQKQLWWRSF